MIKRPTSVTVVAWFVIVIAIISLISALVAYNNPMTMELMAKSKLSLPLQYGLMYGGIALSLVTGIAMLKGQNWARLLYVGWSVIGLVIGLATSPIKMAILPGALLLAVIAFFLFRPKANVYFSPRLATNDA